MAATRLSIVAGPAPPASGRWPLTALLGASGLSRNGLARQLRLAGHTVRTASRRGLSDVQADRWAVRLGLHPVEVWGSSWYDGVGDAGGPSHARVAQHLRSQIERGDLRPGDPLPTAHALAADLRVGVGTVTKAVADLRAEGLVVGGGRGCRNLVAPVVSAAS
jgi:Bacterial regulatory proteins, gntR family